MESLTEHVLNTFQTLWPKLQQHPADLAARLQRRRQTMLNRPPRAWCVALRASDTRITPQNADTDAPSAFARRQPHRVRLDTRLIAWLIAPVYIEPPGEPWTDVAARLGVHEESLRRDMNNGLFNVHHMPPFCRKPGFAGRGKPVPLIYRAGPLNPSVEHKAAPDRIWGDLWPFHGNYVPAGFSQWLTRTPRLRPYRSQMRFRGWTFTCPGCGRGVETIYLPLPVPTVETYLRITPGHPELDAPPTPPAALACVRCHNIRYMTRTDRNGWNELVMYLTAGLLYGHEVPRPTSWQCRLRTSRRTQTRPSIC